MLKQALKQLRGSRTSVSVLAAFLLLSGGLLLLVTSAFSPASEGLSPKEVFQGKLSAPCPGDTNLDQGRDMTDVVLLLRHILKKTVLEDDALANGDLNQDGQVNVQDVVLLTRHNFGLTHLSECDAFVPDPTPAIVGISPTAAPASTLAAVRGWNFASSPGGNLVSLRGVDGEWQCEIVAGGPESVTFRIPAVPDGFYQVTVSTAGLKSNPALLEVTDAVPEFVVSPDLAYVFMPPGSGQATMLIAGGTPPYTLVPPSGSQAEWAEFELAGNSITITGLSDTSGQLEFRVRDSSPSPREVTARARLIHDPFFAPEVEIVPHTLLPGAAPGQTIRVSFKGSDLQMQKLAINFPGMKADLTNLFRGRIIGIGRFTDGWLGSTLDLQLMEVGEVTLEGEVPIRVWTLADDRPTRVAEGRITSSPARIELENRFAWPESVNPGTYSAEWILTDSIFKLPTSGDANFAPAVTVTSVSIHHAKQLAFQHVPNLAPQKLQAVSGALLLERVLPMHGEVGRRVNLAGSGFAPAPAENRVSFAAEGGGRIPAPVVAIEGGELVVEVPAGAVTGPVKVAVGGNVSNDYSFWVPFHAEAALELPDFQQGAPLGPRILLSQPSPEDEDYSPTEYAGELDIGNGSFELGSGTLNLAGLSSGDQIGTVEITRKTTAAVTALKIFYHGMDEEIDGRHVFYVMYRYRATRTPNFWLYASEDEGKVTVELSNEGPAFNSIGAGFDWDIRFTHGLFTPSTPVPEDSVDVRSVKWNLLPGTRLKATEMEVGS